MTETPTLDEQIAAMRRITARLEAGGVVMAYPDELPALNAILAKLEAHLAPLLADPVPPTGADAMEIAETARLAYWSGVDMPDWSLLNGEQRAPWLAVAGSLSRTQATEAAEARGRAAGFAEGAAQMRERAARLVDDHPDEEHPAIVDPEEIRGCCEVMAERIRSLPDREAGQ